MRVVSAALTDVGRKRDHNEDNFFLLKEQNLFIVADGMGGHEAGEVASKMIVDSIKAFYERTHKDREATWPYKMYKDKNYEENRLVVGIQEGNKRIFNSSKKDNKKHGMGTTITTVVFTENGAYSGWVGDSRIYRYRNNRLEMISEDHSLLNEMIKKNNLTQEEIDNFPHKNVILRAIGLKPKVDVDVVFHKLLQNDVYLMCSDGLSGELEDDQMEAILQDTVPDLEEGCHKLVQAANRNGGKDNITVALIQFFDE